MSLVLRKDPGWLETLCSTDVSGGALTLLGKDGGQVLVPAELLVAVSPLVKSMMADLLPRAYSPHVISILEVSRAVLLKVAESLSKGRAVVHANKGEVQEAFKMMRIEAFLSYCVADMEVKDEDLTEDCSQSEIYVKIEKSKESEYYEDFDFGNIIKVENEKIESHLSERNNSPFEVLLPSNANIPEENKRNKDCDKSVVNKNVRQHPVKKPFKCDQCAYRADRSGYLKKHMLIHTEKPFACDECAYRGVSSYRLKQHMLVHSRERPFGCDQSSHNAVSRSQLNQHMLVHSKERPFACDQCTYKAVSRALLKSHMPIHIKEKLFVCDQCDYKTYRHNNLVRHKSNNHGAHKLKLFKCDECDYRAATSRSITQHMIIHTSDKSFACDQCDLKCHKANGHRTHELKTTPKADEPVHCIPCGKLCKSKKRLEKHMERRHSGLATPEVDEPVHFIYCGKWCNSKKRLEKHMQSRHSVLANLT